MAHQFTTPALMDARRGRYLSDRLNGALMTRILVVTPWVPTSRRPRSRGLIGMLAARHDVTLVCAAWSDAEAAEARELPVGSVRVVRLRTARALARTALALPTRTSLQQAYVDDPGFTQAIARAVEEVRPEAVYFNVIRSAGLWTPTPGVVGIVDLDEYRSAYYEQLGAKSRNPLWRLLGRVEGPRMRRAEARTVENFDRVIVSATSDLRGPKDRLVPSPHILPDPSAVVGADLPDNALLFVGRLSYQANVEGLTWFVDQVLPRIRTALPEHRLVVVGEGASAATRRMLERPGVMYVGAVDDVAPYYKSADVSIVPIVLGTGVQMKLIESLAYGLPTVTSEESATRAGVTPDVHCVTASTPGEWVAALVRLAQDADLANRLRAEGPRWAETFGDRLVSDALVHALEG